jgi:hypothetical protein
MALNPIRPRLRNVSHDVAKVQLVIAAGDELEVSEDVAAQLAHQRAPFSEVTVVEPSEGKPKKAPAKKAAAK